MTEDQKRAAFKAATDAIQSVPKGHSWIEGDCWFDGVAIRFVKRAQHECRCDECDAGIDAAVAALESIGF